MATELKSPNTPRFPLLTLLHPREQTRFVLLLLPLAIMLWGVVVTAAGMPIWGATAVVLGIMLVPGVLKWRGDRTRYGHTIMVLSIIIALQGFHSIEHIVQWIQYHLLRWQPYKSAGLISTLNAEWVHFFWNWGVVFVVLYLVWSGVRNPVAWLLLAWVFVHASEHSYMMARYLMLKQELGILGVPYVSAQGLPGILGRDGWLASSPVTQNTFLCRLPFVTTLVRLDIHFLWNTTESVILLTAGHIHLRKHMSRPRQ